MSEPFDTLIEQGKVNQLSTEGQSHTLTDEDESSINKVFGWVGMLSRHRTKSMERPGVQEQQNSGVPKGRDTQDTKGASYTQTEIKAAISQKCMMGLPGPFLGEKTRLETSENVPDKDDLDDVIQLDDEQKNIILGHAAQNSASGLNFIREELETNPYLYMIEERSYNQRESQCQDKRSQNRLASLMSFWESGNKEPEVLMIKKSVTNENKASDRKISKEEFNLSPSKAKTFEYTDICESYKVCSKSHNGTRHDDNISFIPTYGEKMSSFDTVQKPQEDRFEFQSTSESLNSPSKQMNAIPTYKVKKMSSPVLSVRKAITEQDTKAYWEREKSFEIIISTPVCRPKHSTDLNISTSQNRVESPETIKSSSNTDLGESSSKGKLEQSFKRVLVKSPLDDINTESYNSSPLKAHMLGSDHDIRLNPVSYPIRNISSVSQEHRDQSAGDKVIMHEQSRTLSPRHMPKMLSKDSYTVKECRMIRSQLRAFPINISPTKKPPLKGQEYTPKEQSRYTHAPSGVEDSNPRKDRKLLTETAEQHFLSFPENTSERMIQYKLTPRHAPPRFGRSQAAGTVYTDNINSKHMSQVDCLLVSKGQTSVQLITSPKQNRNATTKRLVKGTEDVIPVVLTEQMQMDDSRCKASLTRSCIRLSSKHRPSLAESTHVSGLSDQLDMQEGAGVLECKSSEQASPSQQSQSESEITFDSSSSTSAEAWSLSQTSSACEHFTWSTQGSVSLVVVFTIAISTSYHLISMTLHLQ